MIASKLTIGLAAALLLSAGANVFLLWQWAQAKPECEAKTATAALTTTQAAERAEDARDSTSADLARAGDTNAAQVAAQVDSAIHKDQQEIHNAYFNLDIPKPFAVPSGPCLRVGPLPAGVQDVLDSARSRANAASGIVQAAAHAADPGRPVKK
jgi:hypothetical protein